MGFSKNQLLDHKIQDGRDPPSWKSRNRHISTKNHPILVKFGTQVRIWNSVTVAWPNV